MSVDKSEEKLRNKKAKMPGKALKQQNFCECGKPVENVNNSKLKKIINTLM